MLFRPIRMPVLALVAALLFIAPQTAHAYIGPGAGFAFVSSFFVLFITILLAFFVLLTWPIRWVWRTLKGARAEGREGRVVVVGLDGQDPELTEAMMNRGELPNFARLRERGAFARLQTSLLSESPVAWSSFQTGSNPGKHRIFDFLVPNRKSHLPQLSSANVEPSTRGISIGPYRIPLGKPRIDLGRKSRPFWSILGEHGVFSAILRVPITFPPEKFNGLLLSAMCVPDLKGSQGTYFYYTSDPDERRGLESGQQLPLARS
ncbi:MAG: alkaline phosphatase family protein, partial [Candidatus Sumerlaeota bacterium]|nr:alkaline phosphatase family protein [Candidatus Sumerlaeota bacterium]